MKKCISVVVLFAISSLIYAQNTLYSKMFTYYTEDLYNKALSGDALAQNDLGSCYDRGSGIEQNHDEAFKWFQKSAEQGFVWGEFNLGWLYFSGLGCRKDYGQAVYWYRKSAEQGCSIAQWKLGDCYAFGNGVEKNFFRAVYWYRKSAEQGLTWAQVRLGECYLTGYGIDKDYVQAVKWYQKAVAQGFALSFWHLAQCYENGYGVSVNKEKAQELKETAADKGYLLAQYVVGVKYYEDKDSKALKYLMLVVNNVVESADNAKADAMKKISTCYRYGRCGVSVDEAMADYWMKEAAKYGNVDALKIQEWIKEQTGIVN